MTCEWSAEAGDHAVAAVERRWARTLPRGAAVIDLGCGSGLPITKVLVDEGLDVHAVNAAPSLVEAFRRDLPGMRVACGAREVKAVAMILAAIFALGALAFLLLSIGVAVWVWFTFRHALRSNGWSTTQGTVTESKVVSNRQCNGLPGHHYRVSVDFELRKREYVCKRVRMGDFRYLTRGYAERVARKYSPGASVPVLYDAAFVPDHPDREPVALLEPGLNLECLYPVAVLSLALAGLAFCGASALARIQG